MYITEDLSRKGVCIRNNNNNNKMSPEYNIDIVFFIVEIQVDK